MSEEEKRAQPEQLQPENDVEVTEAETGAARTRPAIFVDAYLVESGAKFFRITLGEGNAGIRERIRFAFIMPTEDVKELANMLTRLLSKVDAEEAGDKTR